MASRLHTRTRWVPCAFAALLASACTAPPDAAKVRCSGTKIPGYVANRDCSVRVERFARPASARFTLGDDFRRNITLDARFEVQQGEVKVSIRGMAGQGETFVIRPDAPATIQTDLHLRLQQKDFTVRFEPVGEAVGLEGTLGYRSR